MTVFAIQQPHRWNGRELAPAFDVSPAEEHGNVEFLLSPTAAPFQTAGIVQELHEKLNGFSDGDFLLLIGNPCLIGIATAIAAHYNNGLVPMLQWSGKDGRYIEVVPEIY